MSRWLKGAAVFTAGKPESSTAIITPLPFMFCACMASMPSMLSWVAVIVPVFVRVVGVFVTFGV